MGRIEKEIEICGEKGGIKTKALLDTGSDVTLVNKSLADKIGVKYTGFGTIVKIADGTFMPAKEAEIKHIQIEKVKQQIPRIFIRENLSREVILGNRFMQDTGITLDLKKEELKFGKPDLLLI